MKFTDKQIKSLKAKEKRYIVTSDEDARGVGRLQVRVYPTGVKKFRVQYFTAGKRKTISIGTYGAITLAEARTEYNKISEKLLNDIDPQLQAKEEKIQKEILETQKTLKQMVDDFYVYINENWADTTIKRSILILNRNLLPYISDELLPYDFDIDQVREIIYRVYNRGAQEQARLLRSIIMSLFKFAIDFDNSPERFKKPNVYGVKVNPVRDISFKTPQNVGDRWLDENEIYKLWHATDIPLHTHNYLKLSLCLAGQRVMELYHAKAEDFNIDKEKTFTIPQSRIKIKKRGDHLLPISHLAEPIIKSLILNRGATGYIFPHRDKADQPAHISTLRMATQRWCKKNDFKLFSPRDIRRTCKTLMGKAGITKVERDILQQHDKGDVSTLHYDRYDYIKEKQIAMNTWTKYLCAILKSPKKPTQT